MTSPTPEPYRRPRFDPQDTLYQRCLGGAALAGALLLVAILLAPIRHTEITRVDQLSRRFARLILEPSAPRPLPSAMATLMPVKPGLAGVHSGDDRFGGTPVAPGAIGATHGTQPDAVIPGGGLRNRGPQPVGPGTGDAGRARAQAEVASVLGDARGSVARALDGLSDALGPAGGNVVASAGRAERVRTIHEARSEDLVAASAAGIGSAAAPDLGHSVVVGSPVSVGGRGAGVAGRGSNRGIGGSIVSGPGNGGGTEVGGSAGYGDGASPDAGVRPGAASAPSGPRSNAALLTVIQKYAAGIQYCYGNQLKHDPTLRGKLVVAVTVGASGEVTQATVVQNTVGAPGLVECALSQIREWRFPPAPEGATTFRAPFVFTPPN